MTVSASASASSRFSPAALRSLMAARGLTLTALAERAGVARRQIVEYRAGREDPSSSAVGRLAAALGVRPGDLFEPEPAESVSVATAMSCR